MKSTISYFKILAGASCALALAACDSVKDVKETPSGILPAPTVVLSGEVNGLSSLRSITLMNNGDSVNAKSFINAVPSTANAGVRPVPFSFGALAVGATYNVTVKVQPELKSCVVVNGQGTLTAGVRPDIVINCTSTGTRYDLTVLLPSGQTTPDSTTLFSGLQGAKVRVTTEEEIREVAVTPGQTSVLFTGVLINADQSVNTAPWSVTASTFEGNRLNKCVVTAGTGINARPSGGTNTNSSPGNVSTAIVGASVATTAPACQFAVSGKVGYSLPAGATSASIQNISGLKLQLRDLQANSLQEISVADCLPTTGAVTTSTTSTTLGATVPVPTNGCDYKFTTPLRSSSTDGLYEVAVSQQPNNQFCLVVNGGSVSVFTTGTTAPVNPINVNVFCRATPATINTNRELQGVFRLQSTVFTPNVLLGSPAPLTSTWLPFDLTKWNTASSNMMAFFKNGTFLYGTHGNPAQAENGFYDYDPAAQKLRFTLITDTNSSNVFPANFSPTPLVPVGAIFTQVTQILTTTPGISALPNPIHQDGATFATAHAAMTGVTIGTANSGLGAVKTISGTFGSDPAGIASYVKTTSASCSATITSAGVVTTAPCIDPNTGALIVAPTPAAPAVNLPPVTATLPCTTTAPCYQPNYAYRVAWTLQEVPQVDHELSGGWVTQDSRRLWVWDYRTYFGTGVGMLGGSPSMNDACFTTDDLHAAKGIYTRRGSGTGCYPLSRPASTGQVPAYFASPAESVDLTLAGASSASVIPTLPGYTGRIPGGEPAPGTSSPSPIYYQVAPAATFATVADPSYFPNPATSWCTTEILGMRASANGYPINPPVYFCRTRAN